MKNVYHVSITDKPTGWLWLPTIRFTRRSCAGSIAGGLVVGVTDDPYEVVMPRLEARLNRLVVLLAERRKRALGRVAQR